MGGVGGTTWALVRTIWGRSMALFPRRRGPCSPSTAQVATVVTVTVLPGAVSRLPGHQGSLPLETLPPPRRYRPP